jgi:hypothetical protein
MSGYIGQAPVVQATQTRQSFTATANQTSFSTLGYQENHLDVFLNGVKLNAADYTATNNSDIVLAAACEVDDILEMVAFGTFEVANQSFTGTTVINTLTVTNDGTGSNLDSDQLDGQHGAYYTGYTDTQLAALVDSSPAALNTLNELAAALGDDANFSTTVTNSIATKLPLAGGTMTGALDVTGTVTADGLTVDTTDQVLINHSGDGGGIRIDSTNATNTSSLRFGDVADNYIGALEYNHSNDAMTMYVNNATRMTLDASGRVLIGTTTEGQGQADNLTVSDSGNMGMTLRSTDSSECSIFFSDATSGAGEYAGSVQYAHSSDSLIFATAGVAKMRITSSGRVGIGTSAPDAPLHTEGASGTQLVVEATSGNFAQMDFKIGGTQKGAIWVNEATDLMGYYAPSGWGKNFYTNGAERMRLIADGSWMVGNTVANTASGYAAQAGVGWVNSDTHFEIATASNRAALEVGKNNSNDGDLIALRKQGNMVGSIGTSGNQSYIHGAGTDVGLFWGSNNVYPYRSTGLNDATIDLGQASKRFKDLYLSGGVVFGPASGSNVSSQTLDSYEEGTYSPTKNNGGSVSYSAQGGHYTKVGELVTVYMDMVISSASGESGSTSVTLPFTSKSGDNYMTFNPWIVDTGYTGSSETASGFVNGGSGVMLMYKITSGNSSGAGYINNNATGRWSGVFTYFAA